MMKDPVSKEKIISDLLKLRVGCSGSLLFGPLPPFATDAKVKEIWDLEGKEEVARVLQSTLNSCLLQNNLVLGFSILKTPEGDRFIRIVPLEEWTRVALVKSEVAILK